MAKTTIYFIRHAQSRPSRTRLHNEWPLSDLGVQQAQKLQALIKDFGIEHVVSSPFPRCLDTVKPFVESHSIEFSIHDDLRERHVIDYAIDNFSEIWEQSWEDFHFKIPGCESSHEAQTRFVKAMDEVVKTHAGRTIGVSTHGFVIALFLNHLDSKYHRLEAETIRNPDVLRLVHEDGRFHWDHKFHLPELESLATFHRQTVIDPN